MASKCIIINIEQDAVESFKAALLKKHYNTETNNLRMESLSNHKFEFELDLHRMLKWNLNKNDLKGNLKIHTAKKLH